MTSGNIIDFVDSDVVSMNMAPKLMDLLRSKCNMSDGVYTLGEQRQKIMEIRRSTAVAYATATIKPQLSSPISSSTPSTSHSKPVSSPHFSNIIPPMVQEQVVVKKLKRRQISMPAHLGSVP